MGIAAGRADKAEPPAQTTTLEGEPVRPLFATNPEINARLTPFRAVWRDSPPPRPVLGQKMSKFMAESLLDLIAGDIPERRIEPDLVPCHKRHPGRGSHAGIPSHDDRGGEGGSQR